MDRDHMTLTQPPDIYTTGACALPVPSGWSAKIFFSHSHGRRFLTLHKIQKIPFQLNSALVSAVFR